MSAKSEVDDVMRVIGVAQEFEFVSRRRSV
jgi:hypothetical protein